MKTKLRKISYIAAAAIFVVGLGINISMSLNDPFENVSSMVLAENTDSGPLKVAIKERVTKTYNEFVEIPPPDGASSEDGPVCIIYEFEEEYIDCKGRGAISCFPKYLGFDLKGTSYGACQ